MTKLNVMFDAEADGRFPLYHHYKSQFQPQPAYLQLDCRTGILTADWDPAIGGGASSDVWNKLILRFPVSPRMHRDDIAETIIDYKDDFQKILDGFAEVYEGGNCIGSFSDEAAEIITELSSADLGTSEYILINEVDLKDFLGDELRNTEAKDIDDVVEEMLALDAENGGDWGYYIDELLDPENMKTEILRLWEEMLYDYETIPKNIAQIMLDEGVADYGGWKKKLIEFAEA